MPKNTKRNSPAASRSTSRRQERVARLHQFVAEVISAKAKDRKATTIEVTVEFASEAANFVAEILLARAKGGAASKGKRRLKSDPQSIKWREAKRAYRKKKREQQGE